MNVKTIHDLSQMSHHPLNLSSQDVRISPEMILELRLCSDRIGYLIFSGGTDLKSLVSPFTMFSSDHCIPGLVLPPTQVLRPEIRGRTVPKVSSSSETQGQ